MSKVLFDRDRDLQRVKHDAGKPQFSDLPQLALLETVKAFNYGANKYSKFSYSEGLEWLRYYDAAQRHLHSWMLNEDIDESGNHHISHAVASLMMLLEAIKTEQGVDNRNKLYKNN
jgi:hypothetical protein